MNAPTSRCVILPAYARDCPVTGRRLWCVWCEHCRRWHWHGPAAGHRVAHCRQRTPYTTTGYVLAEAGPWEEAFGEVADAALDRCWADVAAGSDERSLYEQDAIEYAVGERWLAARPRPMQLTPIRNWRQALAIDVLVAQWETLVREARRRWC